MAVMDTAVAESLSSHFADGIDGAVKLNWRQAAAAAHAGCRGAREIVRESL